MSPELKCHKKLKSVRYDKICPWYVLITTRPKNSLGVWQNLSKCLRYISNCWPEFVLIGTALQKKKKHFKSVYIGYIYKSKTDCLS